MTKWLVSRGQIIEFFRGGACAMTSLHFQNYIVVAFPTKNSIFGRFSSLSRRPPPPAPPPQKRTFYFYCRLAVSERGRQLYFTFPSAPDPLFQASKAPFLTLRVATPSRAPRQAPLEQRHGLPRPDRRQLSLKRCLAKSLDFTSERA